MKVVDSSVGLKLVLKEEDSHKALELFATEHLIAPEIYAFEIRHVLAKLFRQHVLDESEVRIAMELGDNSGPGFRSSLSLLDDAFDLSLQTGCSYWGAIYLALAIREKIEFVTADERLVNNLHRTDVVLLSSLP